MKITIQPELISSLIVTVILSIFFVYAGKKIREADPTKRPKGVVLLVETAIKMVYDYMGTIMPKKYAKNYYPYFSMLFAWLLVSNLFGLTGFDAPTTNYSITLSLTLITWVLIQINAIKYQGVGSYIKGTLIPPTNLFGLISPLISISMRIFCNLLSGTFIMALVYQATSFLSYKLIPFNFLGPVVAPLLHCYFDVFSGCVQALVFVTLSSILISNEKNVNRRKLIMTRGLIAIAAGIAVLAGLGTGIGEGLVAAHAVSAIGRNPEAESKIRTTMILGIALTETVALYGLLISFILLFVFK